MIVVAAAITAPDGRVLVQRRPLDKAHGGLWEFPGGKVEVGETPEAALVRELAEELGITIDAEAARPVAFASEPAGGRHILLLLYRIDRWSGEPCATAADAIAWAMPADLDELPMPPADRPLVAALKALRASAA